MIETVIRDKDGGIINIGPWDDLGGTNPLPADAVMAQEDVTTLPDGGRVVTAEIPTDADLAEREIRGSKALLALARIALGNNTATEDVVVAAIRAKLS